MTTNINRVDFDALVREARIERSVAIGNAIASGVAAVWRAGERVFATIARGTNRLTHASHPPV
jgi:hypothetical protein